MVKNFLWVICSYLAYHGWLLHLHYMFSGFLSTAHYALAKENLFPSPEMTICYFGSGLSSCSPLYWKSLSSPPKPSPPLSEFAYSSTRSLQIIFPKRLFLSSASAILLSRCHGNHDVIFTRIHWWREMDKVKWVDVPKVIKPARWPSHGKGTGLLCFHPLFPPQKSSTRLQRHDAYIASACA